MIEFAYLGIALAVLGLLVFGVRRAAKKNLSDAGRAGQKRIEDGERSGKKSASAKRPSGRTSGRKGKAAKPAEPSPKVEEDDDEGGDEEASSADDAADDESQEAESDEEGDGGKDAEADAAALKKGLAKTRGGFVAKLGKLFSRKKIDEDILGDLEEALFSADIGPKTADKLFSAVRDALSRNELEDPSAVWTKLREESTTILNVAEERLDFAREKPFVLLTIGVNGVGKTTTIGKIAAKLRAEGKSVMLAAGDTFRAAAVEQLEVWGERSGCPVVKGKSGGDPSSVIFDAIKRAQDEDFDVLIADTAGRLQTKVGLMAELEKIGRVIDKAQPGAPHETFLVLDATTGQNAIQQAEIFNNTTEISGIVLTKLDGTAKGGVILGIADELKVPVRYIGIGEQIEDLREFEAEAFVAALYDEDEAQDAA